MNVSTSKLTHPEIVIMIELMKSEYPDFENQEMELMAQQISAEFNQLCIVQDLERYYSDNDFDEDFELESRRLEANYYKNLEEYESGIGFR